MKQVKNDENIAATLSLKNDDFSVMNSDEETGAVIIVCVSAKRRKRRKKTKRMGKTLAYTKKCFWFL